MISKELLGEVLGIPLANTNPVLVGSRPHRLVQYREVGGKPEIINVYELAHICLVHFSQPCIGYEFVFTPYRLCIVNNNEVVYDVMYEPRYDVHILFKACQWILDNKGTK